MPDAAVGPVVARERMAWVDVAKGASIVLVVLLHVTNKHVVRLDAASGDIRDSWATFVSWMRPVRMPLFFLLSGLLAAKVVEPAAGMGVDQGQRALFLLQGPDESDQQAMLHDIGAVAGMEGMAIVH